MPTPSLTEIAENRSTKSAQETLQKAVYLVAKINGDNRIGEATAWAFGPDTLATNAHVTSQIRDVKMNWVLIGPNGETVTIKNVESHPGYAKLQELLKTVGGNEAGTSSSSST